MRQRLSEIRVGLGWTQRELADRSGVPQSTLSLLESGHIPESVVIAARLAKSVGSSLDELFDGAAEMPLSTRRHGRRGPGRGRKESFRGRAAT